MDAIYHDVSRVGSFGGVQHLANASKRSLKEVRSWLASDDAYTLHKQYRLRFPRRKTFSKGIDDLWQADLVDLTSLAPHNDGTKFILVVIDAFTRKAYVVPLKNKSGSSLVQAFSGLLVEHKCAHLQSDKGTEFLNAAFQKLLADNGIKFYTSENEDVKCSIVERFNRTLKTRMWRYFTYAKTLRYIDVLQDFIKSYNATFHSSIKMAPNDVTRHNEAEISRRLYPSKKPILRWKFEVGDKVRLRQSRRAFVKGYLPSWTEEIFVINARVPTDPPTYGVKDLADEIVRGRFYEPELQKIVVKEDCAFKVDKILKTRRRAGKIQYFVHWSGYPSKFDSWVDDILR